MQKTKNWHFLGKMRGTKYATPYKTTCNQVICFSLHTYFYPLADSECEFCNDLKKKGKKTSFFFSFNVNARDKNMRRPIFKI